MELWNYVYPIGNLYIEKELVYGNELIFFTCLSDNGDRYLNITYDSSKGIYIMSKLNNLDLLNMLNNKITMYDAIKRGEVAYITRFNSNWDLIGQEVSPSNINDELLPKKGEYYELRFDDFEQYCFDLKNSNSVSVVVNRKKEDTYKGSFIVEFGKKVISFFDANLDHTYFF